MTLRTDTSDFTGTRTAVHRQGLSRRANWLRLQAGVLTAVLALACGSNDNNNDASGKGGKTSSAGAAGKTSSSSSGGTPATGAGGSNAAGASAKAGATSTTAISSGGASGAPSTGVGGKAQTSGGATSKGGTTTSLGGTTTTSVGGTTTGVGGTTTSLGGTPGTAGAATAGSPGNAGAAGAGPRWIYLDVDNPECVACASTKCSDEDFTGYAGALYPVCSGATGIALDGPGAGELKQTLCMNLWNCINTKQCVTVPTGTDGNLDITGVAAVKSQPCYCGTAVGTLCLSQPNGPCKAEYEAAAETTDPVTVGGTRWTNKAYASGFANAIFIDCLPADGCRSVCVRKAP